MIHQACVSKSSNLFEIEKSLIKVNITPNKEKSVGRKQKTLFESTTF